jgi:hypothetical protein
MGAIETQRTLVKSVPELWAELSEVTALGRMLQDQFGEIRITRLKPESSIEWQSELAAGSVELEPSGFGTRVRLTAEIAEPAQVAEPAPTPAPTLDPSPPTRPGLLARLLRRRPRPSQAPADDDVRAPADDDVRAPAEPAQTLDARLARSALAAVLDEIGAARHRPFSRDAGAPPRIT